MSPAIHLLRATAVLALASATTVAIAQEPDPKLAGVLSQLDTASRNFHSAEANLQWDVYEKIVRDTTTECGSIYYLKSGGSIQMGARTATSTTNTCTAANDEPGNDSRILEYKSGTLQMFEPKANHLDVFRSGPNQAQYESFLTLGFGGSGSDLAKAWNITDQGTEPLKDGGQSVTTVKLDLIAKDPAILKNVSHITIWVDPNRDISLKQMIFTPDGNYRTTYFTHTRYNQKKIDDIGSFEIKPNDKTTRAAH